MDSVDHNLIEDLSQVPAHRVVGVVTALTSVIETFSVLIATEKVTPKTSVVTKETSNALNNLPKLLQPRIQLLSRPFNRNFHHFHFNSHIYRNIFNLIGHHSNLPVLGMVSLHQFFNLPINLAGAV